MTFCGQCGLMLAPGSTTCPRCGAKTEPEQPIDNFDTQHIDDPTMISPLSPYGGTQPPQPLQTQHIHYPDEYQNEPPLSPLSPQQPLILGAYPGEQEANEETSAMATPVLPQQPAWNTPYPVHPNTIPQGEGSYPPPHVSEPGFLSPGEAYPPSVPDYPGNQNNMSTLPPQRPRIRKRRGGTGAAVLIFFLILLLLIGGALVLFSRPAWLFHSGATSTSTSTQLSPVDNAKNVITQYYTDINNKDYQSAYNLWGTNYQSNHPYSAFAAGYAHTLHDDMTIDKTITQANGSIQVFVTIRAQEGQASGTITSTYSGIYTIGQENGTWKILRGTFRKIG